jgi:ribonuclease P protein component
VIDFAGRFAYAPFNGCLPQAAFFIQDREDMSDEAHFSTEQSCARTSPRVSPPDVDSGRTHSDSQPPCARSQEAVGLTTITQRKDFLAANPARRVATPGFVLLVRARDDGSAQKRIGITVTKKIGNAVVRNRMKRRFRALGRELIAPLGAEGADHVLIGRAGGVERDFALLRAELTKAIEKAKR